MSPKTATQVRELRHTAHILKRDGRNILADAIERAADHMEELDALVEENSKRREDWQ